MSILGRADVERIVENVLKDLSISAYIAPWSKHNRIVELRYKDEVISTVEFSVEQHND